MAVVSGGQWLDAFCFAGRYGAVVLEGEVVGGGEAGFVDDGGVELSGEHLGDSGHGSSMGEELVAAASVALLVQRRDRIIAEGFEFVGAGLLTFCDLHLQSVFCGDEGEAGEIFSAGMDL